MYDESNLEREFEIVELESRALTSPDAQWGSGGSGGLGSGGYTSLGSGGSGGLGSGGSGGSGT